VVAAVFFRSHVPWTFVIFAAIGAYLSRTDRAQALAAQVGVAAGAAIGRPVPAELVSLAGVLVFAFAGRSFFGGSGSSAYQGAAYAAEGDPGGSFATSIREAYNQGYKDGVDGLEPRPPSTFAAPEYRGNESTSSSSGSGFGLYSLMRYAMIGSYIYRMGGGGSPGGWSIQSAIAGAKANPMQAMIMLSMLSGSGFLPF
jgi:hypothetical protein